MAIVLLATVVVYLLPAGRAILDDGDALYAQVAAQMLARGDWITPYVDGIRFLDKPPLMYWLMAASYRVFGVNEWAARLPTMFGVAGTAWLLWSIARRAVGIRSGLFAAILFILSAGTLFFTLETFPDIFLVFFLTLSVHCLLDWHRDGGERLVPVIGFGVALGGAVLSKGLIGFLFPVAIAVVFLTVAKGWQVVKAKHVLVSLCIASLIAVPWHVLVGQRNPGFFEHYFINEQWLRFLGRRQPVDYGSIPIPLFWLLILVWFFPWSAFLPAATQLSRDISGDRDKRNAVLIAWCWVGLIVAFFTASARLEHYSFPVIPPLALLVGMTIGLRSPASSKWIDRGFAALAVLGAMAAVAAIGAGIWWATRGSMLTGGKSEADRREVYTNLFSPLFDLPPATRAQLVTPLIAALVIFACGTFVAWWLNSHRRSTGAMVSLAATMAVFCLIAIHSLNLCEGLFSSRVFGRALHGAASPGERTIVMGDFESANSILFYAPVRLMLLDGKAESIERGLHFADAPKLIISRDYLESIWRGPERTFLLGTEREIASLGIAPSFIVADYAGRRLISNQTVRAAQ